MKVYDVAIVGGGAAGIMAAIKASENGRRVILIEKNEKLGQKVLATGNGRCNLTNKLVSNLNYHGASPDFIQSILEQFDNRSVMDFFGSLGVILKEEDRGRVFPRTNQASTILNVLVEKIVENNVEVLLNSCVKKISKISDDWQIELQDSSKIIGRKLILATGGRAAHQLGSSGDGLFWSKDLGHKITPLFAALVPIETREEWVSQVSGLRVEGRAQAIIDNEVICQNEGDVLFTHYGLSGPAIMALSGNIAPYVDTKKVIISIDLFPEKQKKELSAILAEIFNQNGAKSLKNAMTGVVPHNLIPQVLRIAGVSEDNKTAEVSKDNRDKIAEILKTLSFTVKKLRPLKEAQVTKGGIDTTQINGKTLESKILPGLFFAGEILDIDGDSGGFNLQWAWSSGYVAGRNIN